MRKYDEELAVGNIRILDVRHARPFLIVKEATLARVLVMPFSDTGQPLTEFEVSLPVEFTQQFNVVEVWNAVFVPKALLQRGWNIENNCTHFSKVCLDIYKDLVLGDELQDIDLKYAIGPVFNGGNGGRGNVLTHLNYEYNRIREMWLSTARVHINMNCTLMGMLSITSTERDDLEEENNLLKEWQDQYAAQQEIFEFRQF